MHLVRRITPDPQTIPVQVQIKLIHPTLLLGRARQWRMPALMRRLRLATSVWPPHQALVLVRPVLAPLALAQAALVIQTQVPLTRLLVVGVTLVGVRTQAGASALVVLILQGRPVFPPTWASTASLLLQPTWT